jgi:uncharacterized protein (DUF2147 family)
VSSHVPNRTNPSTYNTRIVCVAFASWLIAISASVALPVSGAAPEPAGEWLVAKQIARIKIVDCDGRLWGVVAWEAQPGIDSKNPDRNLQSRPTLGMPILLGMTPSKTNQWDGQIYNSQDGHTYSASISLQDPNTLRVQGCFLGFLCGGENWTRVEAQDALGTASTQSTAPKPPKTRKATSNQPEPTDDVCSRILGPAGLTHERGLK